MMKNKIGAYILIFALGVLFGAIVKQKSLEKTDVTVKSVDCKF